MKYSRIHDIFNEEDPVNVTQNKGMNMKPYYLLLIAAIILALPACEQETTDELMDKVEETTDEVMDKVDDALDRRPAEKTRDAAEDMDDELEDAAEEVKE